MSDPLLVEVTRGPRVESVHRGAMIIIDANGREILSLGDCARPVFPRSAVKLIQALPLVESGAADAFHLSQAELALACASHNAEPRHRDTALAMLKKAGLGDEDLECGPHWPRRLPEQAVLHKAEDEPSRLYNNCSGKHAGFLLLATHMGVDPKGYVDADHPLQQAVLAAMRDMTGTAVTHDPCGTDGCAIPTCAVPLTSLAQAFARLITGKGLSETRAAAAERLFAACWAEPFMVAGSDRFCTDVMTALPGRVYVKTGAEGVFCAAFPERGWGVALKCADGATRGSEMMMMALIDAVLDLSEEDEAALETHLSPIIRSTTNEAVGGIRPSEGFLAALASLPLFPLGLFGVSL